MQHGCSYAVTTWPYMQHASLKDSFSTACQRPGCHAGCSLSLYHWYSSRSMQCSDGRALTFWYHLMYLFVM